MSYALAALRNEALANNDLEISWELMEDPTMNKEIIDAMERVELGIPGLEHIHSVLTDGSSGLVEDELNAAVEDCENELYYAYQLKDMLEKIRIVQALTNTK